MRRAAARAASRRGSSSMIVPSPQPGRVEQRQRHQRRLAGAGRRDQHGAAAGLQRLRELRQDFGDGKDGERGHVRPRITARLAWWQCVRCYATSTHLPSWNDFAIAAMVRSIRMPSSKPIDTLGWPSMRAINCRHSMILRSLKPRLWPAAGMKRS